MAKFSVKELKTAYEELIDVMNLTEKKNGKKVPIIVPKDADQEYLVDKIKEAKKWVEKGDEFSETTQTVLDEIDELEEDETLEEGKALARPVKGKAPVPTTKKPTPTPAGKGKFKREGSFAAFMDEVVKEGGTWDELLKRIKKEAEKRNYKISITLSYVKSHAVNRKKKDPKFLGKLKITEEGIE